MSLSCWFWYLWSVFPLKISQIILTLKSVLIVQMHCEILSRTFLSLVQYSWVTLSLVTVFSCDQLPSIPRYLLYSLRGERDSETIDAQTWCMNSYKHVPVAMYALNMWSWSIESAALPALVAIWAVNSWILYQYLARSPLAGSPLCIFSTASLLHIYLLLTVREYFLVIFSDDTFKL